MAKAPTKTGKAAVSDHVLSELAKKVQGQMFEQNRPRRWPLGLLRLSRGIGGGIPNARFVEVHGPPDSGKTNTAIEMIRDIIDAEQETLQDPKGRRVVVMDHEAVMDLDYAERITGQRFGWVEKMSDLVEVWRAHQVVYFIPPTLEFDARITANLMRNQRLLVSVHDSLAAMTPRALIEDSKGSPIDGCDESRPALLAGQLGKWMPRWKKMCVQYGSGAI